MLVRAGLVEPDAAYPGGVGEDAFTVPGDVIP